LVITNYDTITKFDTINTVDTLIVNNYDTITLYDTIIISNYDTIILHDTITTTIYDTITNTTTDTITQVIYDTIIPCAEVYTYIYATINAGEEYSNFGFTEMEAGTYTNTIQKDDGCDSIVVLYLTVLSGIEDVESSQIMMHPNPTNEKVYLSLINIPNAEITVRDIGGKVVKKEKVSANETEIVLDVNDLASGTYTITINNDKTRITKKLIKR